MSRYITMMKMAMIIGSPGFDIDWRAGRKWNVDDRLTCEGTKRGTLSRRKGVFWDGLVYLMV